MNKIYLDNGATSFPKAPGVGESMANYITNIGGSVNRGAYESAYETENIVFETRELIADLFHYDTPENVVFTKNITESLNLVIKGLLKEGDEVVVSSMEHNAVMRPLNYIKKLKNIKIKVLQCNENGELDINLVNENINSKTKAVFMTHASNVCGTILDLKKVGEICKEKKVYFIVDAAQTAGVIDLDINEINASAIGFTGHKSLLGPQGIGGIVLTKALIENLETFIEGGTGSLSEEEIQPNYMPDKFESGTPNIPGIYGLNTSLKYIKSKGLVNIYKEEMDVFKYFLDGVLKINGVRVIGKKDIIGRTTVCSLDFENLDNGEVSYYLDKEFKISVRCGLHCAPSAHKTLKTFPNGTVRFSFGQYNTIDEAEKTLQAIKMICRE